MTKAFALSPLWLVWPAISAAQIPEISESVVEAPHGSYHAAQVQNLGKIPIVAIHFMYFCANSSHPNDGHPYSIDALVNPTDTSLPLSPGKTVTMSVGVPRYLGVDCPGGVDAILFADGRAEGNPASLDALYARRRGAFAGLQIAMKEVGRAAHDGADLQAVAAALMKEAHANDMNINIDIEERMGQQFILIVAASILKGKGDTWFPADGHNPRTDQLAAQLKIPWPQAHALVLERQLQEWSSGLVAHLQTVVAGEQATQ